MVQELTVQEIEDRRRLRDAIISPYVAQNWDVETDFPLERRVVLKKEKEISVGVVILLFILYIFPAIIYIAYKKLTPEKKTLLY